MIENTSITSVDNLKLKDFYVYSNEKEMYIAQKDSDICFKFNKDALNIANINDINNDLKITDREVRIGKDVVIGVEGNILEYVSWDRTRFTIGDDFIVINGDNEATFNGIITDRNLSQELLDSIKFNRGEQGPPGPQGPPGTPGKDGLDTSRYTWILYSEFSPITNPNMTNTQLGLSVTPNKLSKYMGALYNQMDPQPEDWDLSTVEPMLYEWTRYGSQIYSVKIVGNNIFKIPKNTFGERSVPEYLDFEGDVTFPNLSSCHWEEYDHDISQFVRIKGTENKKELRINYANYKDFYLNNKDLTLDIRFVAFPKDDLHPEQVVDVVSVYALFEGDDTNKISLSNGMHTLIADENGVVLPTEYTNAYTIIKHHLGAIQKNLKVSDFEIRSLTGRTMFEAEEVVDETYKDKKNVKLNITELVDYADILEIEHTPTNILSAFSVYKSGDGTVRVVRVNGTESVWKESDIFVPDQIKLQSYGTGGIVIKKWQYLNATSNGFQDIQNSKYSNLTLNTHEFFTANISRVQFKAIYENPVTKIEADDVHEVILLDGHYNLYISNPQDKVPKNTYNEYDYEAVYSDVTLFQGNEVVPISVIDKTSLRLAGNVLRGGMRYAIGDLALQAKNSTTEYEYEALSGEDAGKIRIILKHCAGPDFITITHIATGQKQVFTILMDDLYATTVDIVGENIFYYDNRNVCKPDFIKLNASSFHILPTEEIKWFYYSKESEWVELTAYRNKHEYIVSPNEDGWLGYDDDNAKFKVTFGYDPANVDVFSIYKIRHGIDSKQLMLNNETQQVYVDDNGNIPKDANGVMTQVVRTNIDLQIAAQPIKSTVNDYRVDYENCTGRLEQTPTNEYTVMLRITDLTADYGTATVNRVIDGVNYYKTMHVYKRADGKVRIVGINGTQTVWKEGNKFKPSSIALNSYGTWDLTPKKWQYKTVNTDGFVDIANATSANITLKTSDYFTEGVTMIQFKAIYTNTKTNIDVSDVHDVIQLDDNFNLALTNYQDKVPVGTYNDYLYNAVYTDVSLFQGNVLVPIKVTDKTRAILRGGIRNDVGDLAIQSKNGDTTYSIEALTGEDEGRVRVRLESCSQPDFLTITHIKTGQKKVFSILMDGKYNTTVDIVAENIFRYDKLSVCKPDFITLQTTSVHISPDTPIKWYYYTNTGTWVEDVNKRNSTSYTVYHDSRWLGFDTETARFKVAYGDDERDVDVMTIYKVRDGHDGVTLALNNETQQVYVDDNGNIPKDANGVMTQVVRTDVNLYRGATHMESTVNDYAVVYDKCSGTLEQSSGNKFTVRLRITDLTDEYGTATISRVVEGVTYTKTMHVYKRGDGKVRIVQISGTQTVWKESDVFKPASITLNSKGTWDLTIKKWQYFTVNTNGFKDVPSGTTANLTLKSSDYFTSGVSLVQFKAIYTNKKTNIDEFDVHDVVLLDDNFNLSLSNYQDKVPINTVNEYLYTSVFTDVSLHQGNQLVPIKVTDKTRMAVLRGGVRNEIGDLAVQSNNGNTTYTIETLSGEDVGKVRIRLASCTQPDFLTITHIRTGRKKVFSILMDGKYNTEVGIIGENIFRYDKLGKCHPDFITLDTTSYHIPSTETIKWFYYNNKGAWVEITSNQGKKTYVVKPGDSDWLGYETDTAKFKVTFGSDQTNVDVITIHKIRDGFDGVTLAMTNESQPISTDENGNIPKTNGVMNQVVRTDINLYRGGTHMESTTSDYSMSCSNCTAVFEQSEGNKYTVRLKITDLSADYGTATVSRTVEGVVYSKTMHVYKSRQGVTGSPGNWESFIYKQSDEEISAPTGVGLKPVPDGWSTSSSNIGVWWSSHATVSGATNVTISAFSKPQRVTGYSQYMHIRYSNSSNGSNMTTNPSGMSYIGLASTSSSTAPTSPSSYAWSKIKGEDGQSVKGEDGKTYYLYVRYSTDGGKTMTTTPGVNTTHMGTCVTENATAPTNVGSYTWVKIKGEPGDKGLIPLLKIWNETDVFKRTATHQDHVAYRYTSGGVEKTDYYTLVEGKNSSQGQAPPSYPNIWTKIESFEILATNTLLAENANLGGFIFKNNKLVSQKTHVFNGNTVPNIELDGFGGKIKASSGEFKGYIEAESGLIGGMNLDLGVMKSTATYTENGNTYNKIVINGNTGSLTASDVNLIGEINATKGKIGEWSISAGSLMTSSSTVYIKANVSSTHFFRIGDESDSTGKGSFMYIRRDDATALQLYSKKALLINSQGTDAKYAISSFGGLNLCVRNGEMYNSAGMLFCGRLKPFDTYIYSTFGNGADIKNVDGTYSVPYVIQNTAIKGKWTVRHGLGHTQYVVHANPYYDSNFSMPHSNTYCRIEEITSTSFIIRMVNADNGNLESCSVCFTMFGRNVTKTIE